MSQYYLHFSMRKLGFRELRNLAKITQKGEAGI